VKENCLRNEWDTNTRGLWCPWASKASQKAATLVDRLRDGWQHLLRDRATRSLTYNDEQFHVLERIKVSERRRRHYPRHLTAQLMNNLTNTLFFSRLLSSRHFILSVLIDYVCSIKIPKKGDSFTYKKWLFVAFCFFLTIKINARDKLSCNL
jgi:hypothetical protein